MNINIEKRNLFTLDKNKYAFVECISLDCETGAGLALEFERQFPGLRKELKRTVKRECLDVPSVVVTTYQGITPVICLITKERFWDKPTYKDFERTIDLLAKYCEQANIKYLAIPKLGCGLDKLSWFRVKSYIEEVFKNQDIEIEVRYI